MTKKSAMALATKYGHRYIYTLNRKIWRVARELGQVSSFAVDGYVLSRTVPAADGFHFTRPAWVRFNKVSL